jgi:hypothetical protein
MMRRRNNAHVFAAECFAASFAACDYGYYYRSTIV